MRERAPSKPSQATLAHKNGKERGNLFGEIRKSEGGGKEKPTYKQCWQWEKGKEGGGGGGRSIPPFFTPEVRKADLSPFSFSRALRSIPGCACVREMHARQRTKITGSYDRTFTGDGPTKRSL